jgi:hypothetical protein
VVESEEFARLVASLGRSSRTAWGRVRRIALNEDRVANTTDANSQLLVKIRANVAYHYSARKLAQSYETFFVPRTGPDDGSERTQALVSDGSSMEGDLTPNTGPSILV